MIDTRDLTRSFGSVVAVDHLTLTIPEGEVFGFLGPNGAGKTTTVRMLTGLIGKSDGEARIDGQTVGDDDASLAVRREIGLLPENVGLYEDVSAYENLDYFGRLYDCPEPTRRANVERLLRMLGLWERRDAPVGTFSKGMKQKVALARALVHDPKVLFLDEPTANLDPESTKTVREFLLELKKEKRTIFLTTHNLDEAQRVCDRIGIMRTRLIAVGTPSELKGTAGRRQTAVELASLDPTLLTNVQGRLAGRRVEANGRTLLVDVTEPDQENPDVVAAVVAAGGRVLRVTDQAPSLEDAYLKLVHE